MAAINCNFAFVLSILLVNGCGSSNDKSAEQSNIRKQAFEASSEGQALLDSAWKQPMLYVLGTLQDGGAPHMGCDRPC